jgi:L-iditol 2-dehydrogenase
MGAGAVGLLVAAAGKINHNHHITIVDIDQGRLNFARQHRFADDILQSQPSSPKHTEDSLRIAVENADCIKSCSGDEPAEFDAVFECTGAQSSLQTAIYV